MKWKLTFSKQADKQLSKLEKGVRRIILSWLLKNIDGCENPRAYGKALSADHSGEWRYRIGDYRVLCDIQEKELIVLTLSIAHRWEVY